MASGGHNLSGFCLVDETAFRIWWRHSVHRHAAFSSDGTGRRAARRLHQQEPSGSHAMEVRHRKQVVIMGAPSFRDRDAAPQFRERQEPQAMPRAPG